jgi:hypothetical protein
MLLTTHHAHILISHNSLNASIASDGVYSHRTDEGHIILEDASNSEYEKVLLNATDVRDVSSRESRWNGRR